MRFLKTAQPECTEAVNERVGATEMEVYLGNSVIRMGASEMLRL